MLRHLSPIPVTRHFTLVFRCPRRQTFDIVADCHNHLIRDKSFLHKIKHKCLRHLPNHDTCLLECIRGLQHLPGTDAVALRPVRFNLRDRTRLIAPRVIDQQLCIDTKQLIQKVFIIVIIFSAQRTPGNISHRIQILRMQLLLVARSYTPEIRQRFMVPQQSAITHLIKLRDPRSTLVRLHMLRFDIHCNLR